MGEGSCKASKANASNGSLATKHSRVLSGVVLGGVVLGGVVSSILNFVQVRRKSSRIYLWGGCPVCRGCPLIFGGRFHMVRYGRFHCIVHTPGTIYTRHYMDKHHPEGSGVEYRPHKNRDTSAQPLRRSAARIRSPLPPSAEPTAYPSGWMTVLAHPLKFLG